MPTDNSNWPETLWHFFDRANKNESKKQLTLFASNVIKETGLEFKLSQDTAQTSSKHLCLTSLPKELIKQHTDEYGKFAIGFDRIKLSAFCRDNGHILNPVLYNIAGHAFSEHIAKITTALVDNTFPLNILLNNYTKDDEARQINAAKQRYGEKACALFKKTHLENICLNIQRAAAAITCLTKHINNESEHKYYLEQEWRLVANEYKIKKNERFENDHFITDKYLEIPIAFVWKVICPEDIYNELQPLLQDYQHISIMTFDDFEASQEPAE